MSKERNSILVELGLGPLWKMRKQPPQQVRAAEALAQSRPAEKKALAETPVEVLVETLAETTVVADDTQARMDRESAIAQMGWDELASAVQSCRACALCESRKQAVLGVGDKQAQWLFVGEGPGAEEDEKGEPFVGQAGKLLDAMLAAIHLNRRQGVYIANAVKCRPPGNRTPEASEIIACRPYLLRQIALLQAKLIVAMGRPAAQTLLTPEAEIKISASRLRTHDHQGLPVVVTYHPAYLLRNLPDKARAWEDLCFAKSMMQKIESP